MQKGIIVFIFANYLDDVLVWNYAMSGFKRGIEKTGMGSSPACIHVGILQNGYIRNVALPRAPQIQSTSHMTSHVAVTCDNVPDPGTCYLQDPRVPTCSDLVRSLQGLGRRQLLPFPPCWLM
jgi:hypothetical protein